MRRVLAALVLGTAFFVACGGGNGEKNATASCTSDQLTPCVVLVAPGTSSGGDFEPIASGSGTVVDKNGLILTNYHVVNPQEVGHYDDIAIYASDDPKQTPKLSYFGELAVWDEGADLAVIRITRNQSGKTLDPLRLDLQTVQIGDSERLAIGNSLTVVGYPAVGEGSLELTKGTVSGFLSGDGNTQAWIKTDARITAGNSGGGAFNDGGEMVGIPSAVYYADEIGQEGSGRIRPVNLALDLIQQAQVTASDEGAPTALADSTPSTGQTPAAPTIDPFGALQSYHYQMQMSGDGATSITIKGSVKAPDSILMDFYLSDSDAAVNSMVIIGTQAWTKNSVSGQWETVDIAEAEGDISGLLPKDFWGDFPLDEIIGVSSDLGEETVNGVTAHHYQISEANADTMAKLAEIFGAGHSGTQPDKFAMDLWRAADGGWPVKATINATYPAGSEVTQASVSWEVSDVNSSAVSIQPPA